MSAPRASQRARRVLTIALAHVGWMLVVAGTDYFGQGAHADPINVWIVWLFAPAAVAAVAYFLVYAVGAAARWRPLAAAATTSLATTFLGFYASFLAFP